MDFPTAKTADPRCRIKFRRSELSIRVASVNDATVHSRRRLPRILRKKCGRKSLTRAAPRRMRRAVRRQALGIVLDMVTQFGNRPEAHRAMGKLRLNGAVGIERVGHAVDDSRLQDRNRALLRGERSRWGQPLLARSRSRRLPPYLIGSG